MRRKLLIAGGVLAMIACMALQEHFAPAWAQTVPGPPRQYRTYAPSLTPAQTSAAIQTATQTFAVTGLSTADRIIVNGPTPTSLCPMVSARVSATDQIALDFTVLTAVACTPASGTYTVVAIRS